MDQGLQIDTACRAAARGIAQSKLIEYDDEANGFFAMYKNSLIKDPLNFIQR